MTEPTDSGHVLVVDDEEAMRIFLQRTLTRRGLAVDLAEDGERARELIGGRTYDLVITDIRMPGLSGLELLHWLRARHAGVPVIVMTGHGSIPSAIEALKSGAEDYITKPFDRGEILKAVEDALLKRRLTEENRLLKKLLEEGRRFETMVGSSPPMRRLYRQIDAVADRRGVVLVTGESGTGKELVARALHRRSSRRDHSFVAFHCASVPPSLLAGELFGVEEGAYTGAVRARSGAVRRADGGVLFLDEIGDVPLEVQPALLRLLESGEVTPIGSSATHQVDVRILAATHRNLSELVASGGFRTDLFYRLNVFPIEVPPLRKRREDIPDLVRHFLALHGGEDGQLSMEAAALLEAYDWPGNVRQLENVIERMLATAGGSELGVDLVPEECRVAPPAAIPPMKAALAEFERGYLCDLLAATRGNVSEAARRAGVSRPTLHGKIQQLAIDPDRYR